MEKLPCVVLVDDDSTTNYINESLLRSLSVTDCVMTARDGAEALALLEDEQLKGSPDNPALLLLDLAMPTMGGMDFLRAHQLLPEAVRDSVRVVILSVGMNSDDLARVDELPIAGLTRKPLTAEKLDLILQLHFRRQLDKNN